MTLRGGVETIALVDLLQVIQGNGYAGTLKVIAGDRTFKLYFLKGQLYLPTGGAGGALKIGALLVRGRKISGKDLLRALQIQAHETSVGLGDVLVREGLVAKADLDAIVRRQFEEEIYEVLFRDGAYFEWRRDVLPAGFLDGAGKVEAIGFDTRSILMEASRRQDEWRRIRERIPSMKAVYRLGRERSDDPEEDSSDADLIANPSSGQERTASQKVLDALRKAGSPLEECPVNGKRNVDDVVALTGLTPFEALGVFARLRDDGLVSPLPAAQVGQRGLDALREGDSALAYKLYSWANEEERLFPMASTLDKVLLRAENLGGTGSPAFSGKTAGARALTILSRLLRRGAPFHFQARAEQNEIDVHLTPKLIQCQLVGPRRTHSASHYLRARGMLSEEEWKRAREVGQKTGRDVDRVLREDRYVSKEALRVAVKDKIVSSLFTMFEWAEPFIEVSAAPDIPAASSGSDARGLTIGVPLNDDLREELRMDLLRWKSVLEAVPSPDAIFMCVKPTPGDAKRAHDLLDGRRAVADLLALAKVAPLELVRFLLEALLDQRIRRLTDKEHEERLEAAVKAGRLDDAIAYAKSAVAFSFSPDRYRKKLVELRARTKDMPSAEGRPTAQGDLSTVSLAEVLQLLHKGKRSGTLRIADEEREKERTIYLDGGDVFILNVEGPKPDAELQAMLGESATDRLAMDMLLAVRGQITEESLEQAEIDRVKNRLFDAFLWDGARFEFLQNVLPPELRADSPNTTKLALKTKQLLFEAIQRLGEWDEMRQVLKSSRAVFKFATNEEQTKASGERGPLAYLFDGKRSLADIVKRSGDDRFPVYRYARDMVQKGLLVYSHTKEPSSRLEPKVRGDIASSRFPLFLPPDAGRQTRAFVRDLLDSAGVNPQDSMSEIEPVKGAQARPGKGSSGSHETTKPHDTSALDSISWDEKKVGSEDPPKKAKPAKRSPPDDDRGTKRWGPPPRE